MKKLLKRCLLLNVPLMYNKERISLGRCLGLIASRRAYTSCKAFKGRALGARQQLAEQLQAICISSGASVRLLCARENGFPIPDSISSCIFLHFHHEPKVSVPLGTALSFFGNQSDLEQGGKPTEASLREIAFHTLPDNKCRCRQITVSIMCQVLYRVFYIHYLI